MELKQLWRYPILLLTCCTCFAQKNCIVATEYQPALCKISLPRISSIKIEENGARLSTDNQKNTDCSLFKLTNQHVQRYFTKALRIQNTEDAQHKLDWLPCYVSGTMRFANNKEARWNIGQDQTEMLVLDGKEMNLYCPDCKFKPFLW